MKKVILMMAMITPVLFSCDSKEEKSEEDEATTQSDSNEDTADEEVKNEEKTIIEFDYRDLNVEEFSQFSEDPNAVLLDVRTADEWNSNGLVDGSALMIDWYDEDFKNKVESEIPKDKSVYVYCHGGGRSSEAADSLLSLGYTNVYNLEEGFMSWKNAGKPVTKLDEN